MEISYIVIEKHLKRGLLKVRGLLASTISKHMLFFLIQSKVPENNLQILFLIFF